MFCLLIHSRLVPTQTRDRLHVRADVQWACVTVLKVG
jgi:hypothetical protein